MINMCNISNPLMILSKYKGDFSNAYFKLIILISLQFKVIIYLIYRSPISNINYKNSQIESYYTMDYLQR